MLNSFHIKDQVQKSKKSQPSESNCTKPPREPQILKRQMAWNHNILVQTIKLSSEPNSLKCSSHAFVFFHRSQKLDKLQKEFKTCSSLTSHHSIDDLQMYKHIQFMYAATEIRHSLN